MNQIILAPEHFQSEGDVFPWPMTDASKEIQLLESQEVAQDSTDHNETVMVDSWYQGGERYWYIDQQPSAEGWVGTRHYDD